MKDAYLDACLACICSVVQFAIMHARAATDSQEIEAATESIKLARDCSRRE